MDESGALELELHEKERQPSSIGVVPWTHSFAAGCLSGMASIVVGQPFDTIKVRVQAANGRPLASLQALLASEGPAALFKGLTSPLLTAAIINGMVFWSYNETQKILLKDPKEKPSYGQVFFSGAVAGAVQCSVLCPTELVKCKLQVQTSNSRYMGPVQCVRDISRSRGLIGLYQGLWPTLLRDIPAFATYFALYEVAKDQLESQLSPWASSFAAGGLAGVASWVVVYPIDMVKTVIQTSATGAQGTLATCRSLLAQHGPSIFFRGMSVALLRALPVNGIVFPVYEGVVKLLDRVDRTEERAGLNATTTMS